MSDSQLCWIDGRVRSREEAGLPVDDSAYAEGLGCYTSILLRAHRPRFEERHLRRLARGALALGLGSFDPGTARRALRELARAAIHGDDLVVRIQLSRGEHGAARVVGVTRLLGRDPAHWSAVRAPIVHPGAILAGGHKLSNRLVHALAAEHATRNAADEALLFDRVGRLVEGARSNVIVVGPDDRACTPPLERGAVAGVAREILLERIPEIRTSDLTLRSLERARAIVCVNAVRGARPLVQLDGHELPGADHPWLARFSEALASEP